MMTPEDSFITRDRANGRLEVPGLLLMIKIQRVSLTLEGILGNTKH